MGDDVIQAHLLSSQVINVLYQHSVLAGIFTLYLETEVGVFALNKSHHFSCIQLKLFFSH